MNTLGKCLSLALLTFFLSHSEALATNAPTTLAATATSNSAVNLTWTASGSNPDIIGYTYAYANNSAFTGAVYKYVAGNGSSSASQATLSTATTYWFKIKAEGTSDALD